jgi:hypothetical protein
MHFTYAGDTNLFLAALFIASYSIANKLLTPVLDYNVTSRLSDLYIALILDIYFASYPKIFLP